VPVSPGAFVSHLVDAEEAARIGKGASIWQRTKLRRGAVIGENTRLGGSLYIGLDVQISKSCKLENAEHL
jgi:UDP-3-O-[3-hydroxymyristoyl] glucosamine N-acyltransferase